MSNNKPDFGNLIPGSREYRQAENARAEMLHHLANREYRGISNPHMRLRLNRTSVLTHREHGHKLGNGNGRDHGNLHSPESAARRGGERKVWRNLLKFANMPRARAYLGKELKALLETEPTLI